MKKISDNPHFDDINVPTYIINLKRRDERRAHILKQFENKPEFAICLVEACEHKIGAIGLWKSMVGIVKMAQDQEEEVIIIVEDDHEFTAHYNRDALFEHIIEAADQGAEILSGGIGNYGYAVPLTANRFWINPFLSTQFIVLYKSVFSKILKYKFQETDAADLVLAGLTSHKMVLFPFISKQKEFGYSDITMLHSEQTGLVMQMFQNTEKRLSRLQHVYIKYLT